MSLNEKFNVIEDNEIKKISYRERGTMAQKEEWKYHEVDVDGNIVSKIEYWENTSLKPPFKLTSGYIKYDLEGNKLEEKNF